MKTPPRRGFCCSLSRALSAVRCSLRCSVVRSAHKETPPRRANVRGLDTTEVPVMQNERTARQRKTGSGGIQTRHARSCPARNGGKCNCKPSYQASIYIAREKQRLVKTFSSLAEARAWRQDAYSAVRRRELRVPSKKTLEEAADQWFAQAKRGEILTRSDRPYKPSTLREYAGDFNTYIRPTLGTRRVSDLDRQDVKKIIATMRGDGWKPSTIRNTVNALRAIYRRLVDDGDVTVNPTANVKLPAGTTRRERVAPPEEADALLMALPDNVRPIYAAAFYSGLRRGELRGLRWEDIDLAEGVIHVRRSWDEHEGEVEPKSAKGFRTAPIPDTLVKTLSDHSLATGRTTGLVFGRSDTEPFTPSHVRRTAEKAWEDHNKKLVANARPESEHLTPIGLHEARHTYVTFMYYAGMPLEEIGDYVGHASTYMTDHYRHLLPGSETEARRRFNEYLARS
jgi:integrase